MDPQYRKIFHLLNLGESPEKLAFGDIDLPFYFLEQSPDSYGFLPALIPIWRDGNYFVGYWKHWFTDRKLAIVSQSLERDYFMGEIAMNFEQLFMLTCMQELEVTEGNTSKIDPLARSLGISIDELVELFGDVEEYDPEHIAQHSLFVDNPPFDCKSDKYKGDRLTEEQLRTATDLSNYCSVEIGFEIKNSNKLPKWLQKDVHQQDVFYSLLKLGHFGSAWLCLNSNGWKFSDAKVAIMDLAREANDSCFTTYAEIWSAQHHEAYINY